MTTLNELMLTDEELEDVYTEWEKFLVTNDEPIPRYRFTKMAIEKFLQKLKDRGDIYIKATEDKDILMKGYEITVMPVFPLSEIKEK